MKRAAFRVILCYLLCLALVAGYSCSQMHRPEWFNYEFAPVAKREIRNYQGSFASVQSNCIYKNWFLRNAEGQELCNIPDTAEASFRLLSDKTLTEEEKRAFSSLLKLGRSFHGDMEYNYGIAMGSAPDVDIPFTKTIITQAIPVMERGLTVPKTKDGRTFWEWEREVSKIYYNHWFPSYCEAYFYENGKSLARITVSGFSGALVFHSDNSVELYGDTRDVTVRFLNDETLQTVTGSGGLYAKIAEVDGEIEVEGLTSYEVEREESNSN